jgi:hypothetical protein
MATCNLGAHFERLSIHDENGEDQKSRVSDPFRNSSVDVMISTYYNRANHPHSIVGQTHRDISRTQLKSAKARQITPGESEEQHIRSITAQNASNPETSS